MLKRSFTKDKVEAGCDEAGRGCLAGPVFAAAVILPKRFKAPGLTDSKQISEKKRDELRTLIEETALDWAVGVVDNNEIDRINILNASFLAMHRAIDQLKKKPELLLIDGNRFNVYKGVDHECIIGGDGKYLHIAAASILAKTHRDEYMKKIHEEFPQYEWLQNKGYATAKHRAAIHKYGSCKYHRTSYAIFQPELPFSS